MGAKADYIAKMKEQLKQWDAEADALAAQADHATAFAREVYEDGIRELRASRAAAQKAFQQMRAAGEAAGAPLQAAMESAWKDMQRAMHKVAPAPRR